MEFVPRSALHSRWEKVQYEFFGLNWVTVVTIVLWEGVPEQKNWEVKKVEDRWTQPQMEVLDLLIEYIPLVEEEDHRLDSVGSWLEPGVLEYRPKKSDRLLEAVHRRVFHQGEVVLGQRRNEDDGGNIFKAMDPDVGTVAV